MGPGEWKVQYTMSANVFVKDWRNITKLGKSPFSNDETKVKLAPSFSFDDFVIGHIISTMNVFFDLVFDFCIALWRK